MDKRLEQRKLGRRNRFTSRPKLSNAKVFLCVAKGPAFGIQSRAIRDRAINSQIDISNKINLKYKMFEFEFE